MSDNMKCPSKKRRTPEGLPRTDSIMDDIEDAYENGWNACHDAFMKVINQPAEQSTGYDLDGNPIKHEIHGGNVEPRLALLDEHQICPVCLGKGVVRYDFYANQYSVSASLSDLQCKRCNGIGTITKSGGAKEVKVSEVSELIESAKEWVQWFDYVHVYQKENLVNGQTLDNASKNWDAMVTPNPSPSIERLKRAINFLNARGE